MDPTSLSEDVKPLAGSGGGKGSPTISGEGPAAGWGQEQERGDPPGGDARPLAGSGIRAGRETEKTHQLGRRWQTPGQIKNTRAEPWGLEQRHQTPGWLRDRNVGRSLCSLAGPTTSPRWEDGLIARHIPTKADLGTGWRGTAVSGRDVEW